jgi:hypothetical protein
MEKRNFKITINKLITSSIFISFIAFLIAGFVVYRLTITKVDSAYDKEFIREIFVEAHGMLFDILVIGTFIFALHSLVEKKREKNRNIQRWKEEIDDYREWESDEAAHRVAGIIKRLNKQNVTRIDLSVCFLRKANLRETNLEGTNLWIANLEGAFLQLANLKGAYLNGTNLQGARMEGSNLEGAKLEGANLQVANLITTNLQGVWMEGSNLEGANLEGANLQAANLIATNLQGAWMEDSNLEGANLEGANLQAANLIATNLQGAYLKEANLQGACLRWAKGLTIEQFSEAKTLYKVMGLDSELKKQIKEKYPHLLEKPKKEG